MKGYCVYTIYKRCRVQLDIEEKFHIYARPFIILSIYVLLGLYSVSNIPYIHHTIFTIKKLTNSSYKVSWVVQDKLAFKETKEHSVLKQKKNIAC